MDEELDDFDYSDEWREKEQDIAEMLAEQHRNEVDEC